MNLYQCQEWAKNNGYNTAQFTAIFPTGPRTCTWLDAYLGLFTIKGIDGFARVQEIDAVYPNLICIPTQTEGLKTP